MIALAAQHRDEERSKKREGVQLWILSRCQTGKFHALINELANQVLTQIDSISNSYSQDPLWFRQWISRRQEFGIQARS